MLLLSPDTGKVVRPAYYSRAPARHASPLIIRCFRVAMEKACRLQRQYGPNWDEVAPEGPAVAEVIVYLSWWWYQHPKRLGHPLRT